MRANVLVMEREQRKLQAVWGKNTEKKNIEMNMEEQVTFKIIGAGTELGHAQVKL